MSVDTEPRLVITTEDTDVGALREGDLLHIMYPAPHLQVVSNESRAHLLMPNRRSKVTLIDSDGVEQQFSLSPKRKVKRVTNPEIPVGPWRWEWGKERDLSDELRLRQRDDALWYKVLWPVTKPFVDLWRAVLDLPCRVYPLKLLAGFWGILFVIVVAAVGLATRIAPELTVAVGIVGAFIVERCWESWRVRVRRKLAKGISMRVRYKAADTSGTRYGTLRLKPCGALIVGGQPGQVWFSTEMCLRRGKRVLATCSFANDIRGDLRYTTTVIAEAIRHQIDIGSDRGIPAPSKNYDPEGAGGLDIDINPISRGLAFADQQEPNQRYIVKLQLHQARILADVLETSDRGR